jgi:hypothetical protein
LFSLLKRGMQGVYQHGGTKHVHRYLAACDFWDNNRIALGVNDAWRTSNALSGIISTRLLYRDSQRCSSAGGQR